LSKPNTQNSFNSVTYNIIGELAFPPFFHSHLIDKFKRFSSAEGVRSSKRRKRGKVWRANVLNALAHINLGKEPEHFFDLHLNFYVAYSR
jgi:hypothetical protein